MNRIYVGKCPHCEGQIWWDTDEDRPIFMTPASVCLCEIDEERRKDLGLQDDMDGDTGSVPFIASCLNNLFTRHFNRKDGH